MEDIKSGGKLNLTVRIEDIIQQLQMVSERLEQTRSAFKSATIAEARASVNKITDTLRLML